MGANQNTSHTINEDERTEFTHHINSQLAGDKDVGDKLPIPTHTMQLFDECRGVYLCMIVYWRMRERERNSELCGLFRSAHISRGVSFIRILINLSCNPLLFFLFLFFKTVSSSASSLMMQSQTQLTNVSSIRARR